METQRVCVGLCAYALRNKNEKTDVIQLENLTTSRREIK